MARRNSSIAPYAFEYNPSLYPEQRRGSEFLSRLAKNVKIDRRQADRRQDGVTAATYPASMAIQKIEIALVVAEVLLGFRFLFQLISDQTSNILVKLFYFITFPLVAPLTGAFNNPNSALSPSELQTLAAMVIWGMIAWATIAMFNIQRKRITTMARR
jgi:hypothetical protein